MMVQCASKEAGNLLLGWVKKLVPDTTIFDIIYLQVNIKAFSKEEMVVTWVTALTLHNIWMFRNKGGLSTMALKSEVFAANLALYKTKFSDSARIISTLIA